MGNLARVLLSWSLPAGKSELWAEAIAAEAPLPPARPRGCSDCPLRKGGEWEASARASLPTLTSEIQQRAHDHWACHQASRPCAGMRRLLAKHPPDLETP